MGKHSKMVRLRKRANLSELNPLWILGGVGLVVVASVLVLELQQTNWIDLSPNLSAEITGVFAEIMLVYFVVDALLKRQRRQEWKFAQRWILGKAMHIIALSTDILESKALYSDPAKFRETYLQIIDVKPGSGGASKLSDSRIHEEIEKDRPDIDQLRADLRNLGNDLQRLVSRFAHVMDHEANKWVRDVEEMALHALQMSDHNKNPNNNTPVIDAVLKTAKNISPVYWEFAEDFVDSKAGILKPFVPLFFKSHFVGTPENLGVLDDDAEFVQSLIWLMCCKDHLEH